MGSYKINLVDASHYQHVIDGLEPGAPIKLLADPENLNDPRSVKATYKGETIGYVEQDSWLIRAMHDDRTPVASRIDQITGREAGQTLRIVLEVRTGVDAEMALGRAQPAPSSETTTKTRGCGFWILIGGAVLLGLVFLAALFGPSAEEISEQKAQEAVEAESDAVDVTAEVLWFAYSENEAAAQQNFGNIPLRITGKIDGVQLDFSDKPFVTLETGNMFQSVHLQFANASDPAITELRKGDEVTAVCTSVSEVVGTPVAKGCALR